MNYATDLTPEVIFKAHTQYATALARHLPPPNPPMISEPAPDRRIRLGIIIPDLIKHSVAYFIRPFLERLDVSRFTLFIYYTSTAASVAPDWKIATHTPRRIEWEPLPRLNTLVRADRLDMLMDLCGMSTQHRLPLMHLKPAPIQLTYAGYPNSSGMPSIDYRIVDSHTDPAGADAFATEKLVRLDPCFLCYSPPADAPAPSPPPSASGQPITFGSFNHLPKLNFSLFELWSRILQTVPNSRLLLKASGLQQQEVRTTIERLALAVEIDPSRLELLPPTASRAEHLATYARIDIALDPFPYHGTTTTCEAIFMGVPVISLAGVTHVSRVGVSLLRTLGLHDLIATNEAEYIQLAATLAANPARLQSLRIALRPRMQSSPLCDEASFAVRFQSLLRTTWQVACNRPTPQQT